MTLLGSICRVGSPSTDATPCMCLSHAATPAAVPACKAQHCDLQNLTSVQCNVHLAWVHLCKMFLCAPLPKSHTRPRLLFKIFGGEGVPPPTQSGAVPGRPPKIESPKGIPKNFTPKLIPRPLDRDPPPRKVIQFKRKPDSRFKKKPIPSFCVGGRSRERKERVLSSSNLPRQKCLRAAHS